MSSALQITTASPTGFSRRAAGSPCTFITYYGTLSVTQVKPLKCFPKKVLVCRASSSGQRRNPDFPRQNKQGFSRSRNRQNDERDNFENFEESEPTSSKNGSLLSLSDTPKFQATAVPGPREKEIVELFRKVQAQLRERAAIKEERKIEALQGKGKENETVDSLLKLLRKHSVEQGKKSHNNKGSGDFVNHHSEPNGRFNADRSPNPFKPVIQAEDESKPPNAPTSRRPVSNFRRKSPVPQVKFQPVYTRPAPAESVLLRKKESKIESHLDDLDLELEEELDHEPETEVASLLSNMAILHEAASSDEENDESENDEMENEEESEVDKEETADDMDLASLKLAELRALAKARGLKGFSKLKKGELVELLK